MEMAGRVQLQEENGDVHVDRDLLSMLEQMPVLVRSPYMIYTSV